MRDDKKLRILIYTYPMIGQNYGGLQIQIENTIHWLTELGCEVTRFNPWTSRIEDFDILHCFYLGDIGAAPLIQRAKEKNVKVIISTVYNSAFDEKKEKITNAISKLCPSLGYVKYVQNQMIRNADRFVALSDFERDAICRIFKIPKDDFSIVPNGIGEHFLKENRQENSFCTEMGIKDYVLHVGQFTCNKNQIALIKALHGTGIPLVCIGQKVEEAYYRQCREAADENVYFCDPVENASDKLQDIYNGAKLFVLPSLFEAYPISVLEALAAGNRVLMTERSMVGSSLAQYGVEKVSPRDEGAIRSWIQNHIASEKKQLTAEEKAQFSWKEVANKLLRIYNEVLNEKTP